MGVTMNEQTAQLDLTLDPVALTAALVDIPSRSHEETAIADALESGLVRLALPGVTVDRRGNTVISRTHRGLTPFRRRTTCRPDGVRTPRAATASTGSVPWT